MSTYPSVVVYDTYYSCGVVRSVYFRYFSAYNVIGHLVISRRWYIFCDTCVWLITCEHGSIANSRRVQYVNAVGVYKLRSGAE